MEEVFVKVPSISSNGPDGSNGKYPSALEETPKAMMMRIGAMVARTSTL